MSVKRRYLVSYLEQNGFYGFRQSFDPCPALE